MSTVSSQKGKFVMYLDLGLLVSGLLLFPNYNLLIIKVIGDIYPYSELIPQFVHTSAL